MSITDELREWILHIDENPHLGHLTDGGKCGLRNIAVYIDAAHRSALEKLAAQLDETSDMREFCERLDRAATNREDVTLWGVDYVPLPVDADGVPIHVGDRLTDGEYTFTVCELATLGDGSWSIRNEDGNAWAACDVTHSAPTVEDVLREFALACEDAGNAGPEVNRLAAEFSARLRLAGSDAE